MPAQNGSGGAERLKMLQTCLKSISGHILYFVNRLHTVCKHCHTKIKYVGNTTNLRNHVSRFHPEMLTTPAAREMTNPVQPRIDTTPSTIAPDSEKGKRITQAVAAFKVKDLRPHSVVDDVGFRHLLKFLEPQYRIRSCSHFTLYFINTHGTCFLAGCNEDVLLLHAAFSCLEPAMCLRGVHWALLLFTSCFQLQCHILSAFVNVRM